MDLNKKIPSIKKNIEAFLTSEEGKISKKSALELGIGVTMLGTVLAKMASSSHKSFFNDQPDESAASHLAEGGFLGTHSSYFTSEPGKNVALAHTSHGSHASHGSHTSHGSHGSHSSHGSHGSHGSHSSHSSHSSHGSHISHSSHSSHGSHISHGSHSSHSSHGSHSSHSSHGSHSSHSSHGSHSSHTSCGCPFVSVWDGKRFVLDNNILPGSETIQRKETTIEEVYKLEKEPALKEGKYVLRVMEFEREHSYFEDFKLIKVTHPEGMELGVLDNKIMCIKKITLPYLIEDSEGRSWTKKLSRMSDKEIFEGKKETSLVVKFNDTHKLQKPHLVFRANLRSNHPRVGKIKKEIIRSSSSSQLIDCLQKAAAASLASAATLSPDSAMAASTYLAKSIELSIHLEDTKKTVHTVHPREHFSLGLTDLSDYIKESQDSLSLQLDWTATHNISFVALGDVQEMKEQTSCQETGLKLLSLFHSEDKEVGKGVLENGKVELTPGQYLQLEFEGESEERKNHRTSYFLKTRGYYRPF